MKSAILCKTNSELEFQELELPKLEKGQVLVKILYSGLCRSQLNEISAHKGPDKYLPHTLGHEASAIVQEVGSDVTKVNKNDYVVVTWIKGSGIDTPSCQYTNKNGKKINSGAVTTFNEYSVVSENRVVKIPKEVPPEIGALLGCAIPTGVGIVKNELKMKSGESIAIFGIGGVGSAVLLGAVAANASTIIAVDINEDKLEFAKKNGATHVINSKKDDVVSKIKEIIPNGVDYSVDCSGIPSAIEAGFEAIKDTGLTVIAGNPKQGETISIIPFEFIKGKKIIGSWGGNTNPDVDIPIYADDYLKGKLKISNIISKIYDFKDINTAIKDFKEGKVVKLVIKIGE